MLGVLQCRIYPKTFFSLKYYENSVAHNLFHCCAVALTVSYPVPNFKAIGQIKFVFWTNEIPWDLKFRWISWGVWGDEVGGVGMILYNNSPPIYIAHSLRGLSIDSSSFPVGLICTWYKEQACTSPRQNDWMIQHPRVIWWRILRDCHMVCYSWGFPGNTPGTTVQPLLHAVELIEFGGNGMAIDSHLGCIINSITSPLPQFTPLRPCFVL